VDKVTQQTAASTDPLGDAISVLERIDLVALSAHPETEDAGNRVAVALGYLRAVKIDSQVQARAESQDALAPITALLRGDRV
jgi:hypothetical protein